MDWHINRLQWRNPGFRCSISRPISYHRTLSNYQITPLLQLPSRLVDENIGKILVKDEGHRFGLNAFKGLGASYAIHRYIKKYGKPATFCTATDGNHGKAVAWAARNWGIRAVVFMPAGSSMARVEAIEALGAEVKVIEHNYDRTVKFAAEKAKKYDWALIQDTAWQGYEEVPLWIMEGYLTQMVEIVKQLEQQQLAFPSIILLQSGVGSWASSVVWFLREFIKQSVKVILVEPVSAAGGLASARAGKRVTPDGKSETVMAGLNCGIPSYLAWPVLRDGVDLFLAVEDRWAIEAKELYGRVGISSGESGAASLGGLLAIFRHTELSGIFDINEQSSVLLFNTEGLVKGN